ncbi:hypothetical protein GQ43DRAFT_418255 [Delitschia confertaspora ATCC 74209]|uniref:Formin GTPase-binding domain-containing protein n=1 Tax=Delitschia confertaspora ATCC 74209 TaxID=1513339 RepID=A0A9P4JNE9_9PLEO|nr:hypothetical protein GQ43DRAFT_418255 [Delitschia confertaspora ATCC 74209]
MASMATTTPIVDRPPGHRRNKSAAVLKAIINPKAHRRAPSDGTVLEDTPTHPSSIPTTAPFLPPDHPHNPLTKQKTSSQSQGPSLHPTSPRKSNDAKGSPKKSLHKRTMSSVSLKSLVTKDKEKEKTKEKPSNEEKRKDKGSPKKGNPVKTKSSTNLAGMFQKSKPSKEAKKFANDSKDKENTTPPSTADATQVHTPIWAQFSSQPLSIITTTSKLPLNDRRSIEEEIALYTPSEYSPSKQRNFFDYGYQPSLRKRTDVKERPKSTFLPSTSSSSLLDNITRKLSSERTPLSVTKGNEDRRKEDPRLSARNIMAKAALRRANSDGRQSKDSPINQAPKKGSRVMAAVAAFNSKSRETGPISPAPMKMDPQFIEAEFEVVLESRNIPQHQREQMRTLKLDVKAEMVRTHRLDTPQSRSRQASGQSLTAEKEAKRSILNRSSKSKHESRDGDDNILDSNNSASSTKRSRPRSKTFTFGKGDAPTKKPKADAVVTESKTVKKSPSSRSLASNGSQKSNKSPNSTEFVEYLRKVQIPQEVEVGKVHKLRLLLRTETVDWVDTFIEEGGMTELVGLLHRIMAVEWREEHEDQLLHEALRALKGLCTTDAALKRLCEIAPSLFPVLLAMLFDEEHKGPSEFTTRELIISLLFIHLSAAPENELASRAYALLEYLQDPIKEKESSTIPFILEMHERRPYKVWCKEITNVTKEVFWIFIHYLNVFPIPPPIPGSESKSYAKAHFPGPRVIVPAAPYVGGVEWDATNYIATHIDLVNGLIASLPTQTERNALRSEFKASGFEKLMGHLRACNPKYYGAVHDSVKVWIKAAVEDGWDVRTVRMGAGDGKPPGSPLKSSPKKVEPAPKLEAPKMDLGLGLGLDVKFDEKLVMKKDDDWF